MAKVEYNKATLLMVILSKVQSMYAAGEYPPFFKNCEEFTEELIKHHPLCVLGVDSKGRDINECSLNDSEKQRRKNVYFF